MKSFVMINNFIVDDTRNKQLTNVQKILVQNNNGGHARSISTGNAIQKRQYQQHTQAPPTARTKQQFASEKRTMPQKSTTKENSNKQSHVSSTNKLRNPNDHNSDEIRRQYMTEFVHKISTPIQLQKRTAVAKSPPGINQAIQNLKQFVQTHQQYRQRQTPINNYVSRPGVGQLIQGSEAKHRREMSVRQNKPFQPQIVQQLPQKELIESRIFTHTNLTEIDHNLNEDSLITSPTQSQKSEAAYVSRNDPIPAFTSIEIKQKLRYHSENRYINNQMESELQSYKLEIEKRYQNSTINNGYVFPKMKLNVNNKENNHGSFISAQILASPYGNIQLSEVKEEGKKDTARATPINVTSSVKDYKKILSKFLSSSLCSNSEDTGNQSVIVYDVRTNGSAISSARDVIKPTSQQTISQQHVRSQSDYQTYYKNFGQPPNSVLSLEQKTHLQLLCDKVIQNSQAKDQTPQQLKKQQTFEYSGMTSRNPTKTSLQQNYKSGQSSGSEYYKTLGSSDGNQKGNKSIRSKGVQSPTISMKDFISNPFVAKQNYGDTPVVTKATLKKPKVYQQKLIKHDQKKTLNDHVEPPLTYQNQFPLQLKSVNFSQKPLETRNAKQILHHHSRARTTLYNSIENISQKRHETEIPLIFNEYQVDHHLISQRYASNSKKLLASSSSQKDLYNQRRKSPQKEDVQNVLALRLSNNNIVVESRPKLKNQQNMTNPYAQHLSRVSKLSSHTKSLSSDKSSDHCPYNDASAIKRNNISINSTDSLIRPFVSKRRSSSRGKQAKKNKQISQSNRSSRKRLNLVEISSSGLKSSESKRDFKIKCLKIDLYKQAQSLKL